MKRGWEKWIGQKRRGTSGHSTKRFSFLCLASALPVHYGGGGRKMAKMEGWSKLVNTRERIFWKSSKLNNLNVEKINKWWYIDAFDNKGIRKFGNIVSRKDLAMKYASRW